MSEPLDLDAIEARAKDIRSSGIYLLGPHIEEDTLALIAEVRRLRQREELDVSACEELADRLAKLRAVADAAQQVCIDFGDEYECRLEALNAALAALDEEKS